MSTNKRPAHRNIVQVFLGEYVMWGGPIVTRQVAYDDCIARGMTTREADICAFGRPSVPAPADPAAHAAFLVRINEMEAARA